MHVCIDAKRKGQSINPAVMAGFFDALFFVNLKWHFIVYVETLVRGPKIICTNENFHLFYYTLKCVEADVEMHFFIVTNRYGLFLIEYLNVTDQLITNYLPLLLCGSVCKIFITVCQYKIPFTYQMHGLSVHSLTLNSFFHLLFFSTHITWKGVNNKMI